MASVASEPLKHLDEEDQPTLYAQTMYIHKLYTYIPSPSPFLYHLSPPSSPPADNVISVYEEHEDSVYNVKWSTTDAWIFASLSYDGRLVINHVPTNEKYAILTA